MKLQFSIKDFGALTCTRMQKHAGNWIPVIQTNTESPFYAVMSAADVGTRDKGTWKYYILKKL